MSFYNIHTVLYDKQRNCGGQGVNLDTTLHYTGPSRASLVQLVSYAHSL